MVAALHEAAREGLTVLFGACFTRPRVEERVEAQCGAWCGLQPIRAGSTHAIRLQTMFTFQDKAYDLGPVHATQARAVRERRGVSDGAARRRRHDRSATAAG